LTRTFYPTNNKTNPAGATSSFNKLWDIPSGWSAFVFFLSVVFPQSLSLSSSSTEEAAGTAVRMARWHFVELDSDFIPSLSNVLVARILRDDVGLFDASLSEYWGLQLDKPLEGREFLSFRSFTAEDVFRWRFPSGRWDLISGKRLYEDRPFLSPDIKRLLDLPDFEVLNCPDSIVFEVANLLPQTTPSRLRAVVNPIIGQASEIMVAPLDGTRIIESNFSVVVRNLEHEAGSVVLNLEITRMTDVFVERINQWVRGWNDDFACLVNEETQEILVLVPTQTSQVPSYGFFRCTGLSLRRTTFSPDVSPPSELTVDWGSC
jgi:hypothetical protein